MNDELEGLAVERVELALALLEQGWCQQAGARGRTGQKVRFDSPRAVAYCGRSALWVAMRRQTIPDPNMRTSVGHVVDRALMAAARRIWGLQVAASPSVILVNDSLCKTQAEAVDWFVCGKELIGAPE